MHVGAAVKKVLDFCYPTICASCGAIEPESKTPNLCATCDEALLNLSLAPACARCAKPLAYDNAPCPYCEGRGFRPIQRIVALGVFNDPLKDLIHHAKYHRAWQLAEAMADRLLATGRGKSVLAETDVIVPVPLHIWRHIARGYNQAEVIANQLGRRTKGPVKKPAVRMRPTVTQTHLHSRAKRMANLRGAFALVEPQHIAGKHVTLVDDVMTTGATLRSVARTLMDAGPASIDAIVLAVADPRGRGFEQV
jgi:ComF family protein